MRPLRAGSRKWDAISYASWQTACSREPSKAPAVADTVLHGVLIGSTRNRSPFSVRKRDGLVRKIEVRVAHVEANESTPSRIDFDDAPEVQHKCREWPSE